MWGKTSFMKFASHTKIEDVDTFCPRHMDSLRINEVCSVYFCKMQLSFYPCLVHEYDYDQSALCHFSIYCSPDHWYSASSFANLYEKPPSKPEIRYREYGLSSFLGNLPSLKINANHKPTWSKIRVLVQGSTW